MEFFSILGVSSETIKWFFAILGMAGFMEYLKIYGGRFYKYKDISGVTIIKDRDTNQKYMKVDNTMIKLDK